ncbi:MAG TPA: hypothetical protein VGN25_01610 [Solirubrobacteraceae bacterium]|jgi:hypothetical protein|nr:hypothetical protein [Solirubrobacteraceae bacterium]
MDHAEWAKAGRRLGEIGRGSQWWIGDWMLFGTEKWGERYLEASRLTGYDPKSLRNIRYVASRFPPSLRRDELNWSHHALLAGLDRAKQRYWLDRAVVDRLSVDDLRCELRSTERGLQGPASVAEDTAGVAGPTNTIVCPNCGSEVSLLEDQKVGGA